MALRLTDSPPDIVWIVADHQIHATAPGGVHPLQARLARTGVSFTQARTVLPICTPARASMLTGLYPHAHGLTENDGRFGGRSALSPDQPLVHTALVEAGYRVGWFGKWHVDNEHAATAYGFEGFSPAGYGYPYGTDAYRLYLDRLGLPDPVARVVVAGESGTAPGTHISLRDDSRWFDDESGVLCLEGDVRAHEAFFVTDLARRWHAAVDDAPRFVRIDPWGPHPPYLLGRPYRGCLDANNIPLPRSFSSSLTERPAHHRHYRDGWQRNLGSEPGLWRQMYQAALEQAILVESALDDFVATLDLERTRIIFTADHGDAVGTSGGVANKGALMTEATLRIPLQMAGAGLGAGIRNDALVTNMDIMPTVLTLAGAPMPGTLHGRSLDAVLAGTPGAERAGVLAQHYGLHEPMEQRAWCEAGWKLVVQADGFTELYALDADPDELTNLAGVAAHGERLCAMAMRMSESMRLLRDDGELHDVVRAVSTGALPGTAWRGHRGTPDR